MWFMTPEFWTSLFAFLTALVGAIVSVLNHRKSTIIKRSLDGRLTELVLARERAAKALGKEEERLEEEARKSAKMPGE
jgi:hypothetical protein